MCKIFIFSLLIFANIYYFCKVTNKNDRKTPMKLINQLKYLTFSFIIIICCSQCMKSEQDIGGLPLGDIRNAVISDTFSVAIKTVLADSFISSNSALMTIGNYNDEKLGKVEASHYSAVRLDKSNVQFSNDMLNLRADSLVLQLPYFTPYPTYGYLNGSSNTQTIEVYELTEKIEPTKYYYSNSSALYNPVPVGSVTVTFNTLDSIYDPVVNQKLPPHLRIKLDQNLALRFLQEGTPGRTGLQNNNNFVNWFKGFYMKSTTVNQAINTGAIAHFNPKSNLTTLSLYYTTLNDNITKKFNFLLDANVPQFNSVKFDRLNTDAQVSINASNAYQTAYVQSLGGLVTQIDFPNLDAWANGKKIVIHQATLDLGVNTNNAPPYTPIEKMYILSKGLDNKYITISDYLIQNTYNYVSYNTTANKYSFGITNFLQEKVGKYNTATGAIKKANYKGLYLQPEFNTFLYRRSAIDASKVKLKLIYEVLE